MKKNNKENEETNNKIKFCTNCGEQLEEHDNFCAKCGTSVNGSSTSFDDIAKKASATVEKVLDTEDNTKEYSKKDIDNYRAMAIIGYFGPLALLPYFGQKNSKFAQFHAINGMNLFIWEIVYYFLYGIVENFCSIFKISGAVTINGLYSVSSIPWYFRFPLSIIGFILVTLSIIGIVFAACGKAKELPVIGKFKIIRK